MLQQSTDAKLDGNVGAGIHAQDLSVAGGGEGALVADDVVPIDVGVVADVLGRVGRELDGVVVRLAGELADVLEPGRLGAIHDDLVEEVVGGSQVGSGPEENGGSLHCGSLVREQTCCSSRER